MPDGCKNDIFVPYVCTYGVRLFYEIKLLREEDIPTYKNLEKIPRITGSSCSQSGRSAGVLGRFLEQI